MSGGLYNTSNKKFDTTLNLKELRPYGDTMNDGKVQMSFTLPVKTTTRGRRRRFSLPKNGTQRAFGGVRQDVGRGIYLLHRLRRMRVFRRLHLHFRADGGHDVMSMEETDEFIRENFGRKLVVVGASTGTDAHTVGIDAIMNRKGFAGHYGLERYDMIEAYNMGSQVPNEEFIAKAKELKADILLVSQTVTQKGIHIENLTNLVELMEAEHLRDKVVLCCGGARITHELAKELGYDAGFGPGKYADDVISFAVNEMLKRGMK